MDFQGAKYFIIQKLIHELPSKLYYHGLHHTFDVYDAAKRLATMEQVTGDELILLKTSALFHDAGFIEQYKHNEPIAVKMAEQSLPQFGYNDKQIAIIADTIMATSMKKPPQTILEKIMCDADLDYLGRSDFNVLSGLLKKELNTFGFECDEQQWDEIQIKFLEEHKYHTESAVKRNEIVKQQHIEEIKSRYK